MAVRVEGKGRGIIGQRGRMKGLAHVNIWNKGR